MGLATSCLKAPKTAEFQNTPKLGVGASSSPKQETQEATTKAVAAANVITSGKETSALPGNAIDTAVGATTFRGASAQAAAPAAGQAPSVDLTRDLVLESHLSDTLDAMATLSSLQSTYQSSLGYPYSNYDLGPPCSDHEQTRLQALRALDVLDSLSQGHRSRLDVEVEMILGAIMQLFRACTAMLVFFEDSRIIIRNSAGIMQPGDFPYRWSLCAYTLTKHKPQTLVVPDTTKDSRFSDNPFVLGAPHVRFYVGSPLISSSGHILGTVCFADTKARADFDVSQCYLMNNMAELMVRQLERFRANAGPSGPMDAETTALKRVARTIECYETVTGLVDVSLSEGWMLMYVNEAWDALCSPWERKQLIGRPLQRLLELEPDSEHNSERRIDMEDVLGHHCIPEEPLSSVDVEEGKASIKDSTAPAVEVSIASGANVTSGGNVISRTPSTSCSNAQGQGIVIEMGTGLMPMLGSERRGWRQEKERRQLRRAVPRDQWQRHAAALRCGEEVDLGRVRLLLEDGRPSTTLAQVHVRPANCHVLDAATRMPVGVPSLGLPASIQTVEGASGAPAALTADHDADGTTAAAGATPAAEAQAQPHYCFVTLSLITDEVTGEWQEKAKQQLLPVAGSKPRCDSTGGGGSGLGAVSAGLSVGGGSSVLGPSTPAQSAHLAAYDSSMDTSGLLPARGRPQMSQSGRPSLDAGSGYGSSGGRRSRGLPGIAAAAAARASSLRSGQSDVHNVSSWAYGMEPLPGLKLGHMLGKGGYGRVFMASYKGQRLAAKVVSNSSLKTATCVNGVTLEALLAQELSHPYIVQTYKCVVRTYMPIGRSSMDMSARGPSLLSTTSLTTAAMSTDAGGGAFRSFLPPVTPSARSALPFGPSDGEAPSARLAATVRPSDGGTPAAHSPPVVPIDGTGGVVKVSNACPPALPGTMKVSGGWPSGAAGSGEGSAAATARADDFDSFDAGGDEQSSGGGGMIDQLTSAGPQGPYVPPSAASHAGMPSRASVAGTVHSTGPTLPYTASIAGAGQASYTTPGSALTMGSNVDLVRPGRPPHAPGVADPYAANGGADVFGSAAAAAAAACAGASLRQTVQPVGGDALPEGETWILQEYCSNGTLQDAIDTGRLRTEPSRLRGQPDMPVILVTAQEIASAMNCLHGRGYMHGDLSAVNVLLTDAPATGGEGGGEGGQGLARAWVAKVSDFGLAKHLPDPTQPCISAAYGVITHSAPEVLKSHTQTQKADSYSFGVLLWQMFTGSRPWANMNRFQIFGAVTTATAPGLRFLPTHPPPDRYRDLAMSCMSYDPDARPTFSEICEELRLMTLEAATANLQRG